MGDSSGNWGQPEYGDLEGMLGNDQISATARYARDVGIKRFTNQNSLDSASGMLDGYRATVDTIKGATFIYDAVAVAWRMFGVPRFALFSDIAAAITNPVAGYRAMVGSITYYYTGSAWVDLRTGWVPITPTAVSVSSGTATITGGAVSVSAAPATCQLQGIFADDYPEYEVRGAVDGSVVGALGAQLLVGATPDSSGSYDLERAIASSTTASAANTAGGTSWSLGSGTSRGRSTFRLRLARPKRATFTSLEGSNGPSTSNGTQEGVKIDGQFRTTTQFDGLALTFAAGTGQLDIAIVGLKLS